MLKGPYNLVSNSVGEVIVQGLFDIEEHISIAQWSLKGQGVSIHNAYS